jgi:hypothetical protein
MYQIAALPIRNLECAVTGLIPSEWCGGSGNLAGIYEELRTRQTMLLAEIISKLGAPVLESDTPTWKVPMELAMI